MSALPDLLASLEATVSQLGRDVVRLLQPGLPRTEIESQVRARRLTPVEDHVALYEWRDGTDTTTGAVLDDLSLVPGFYLLSLGDALSNYDAFV